MVKWEQDLGEELELAKWGKLSLFNSKSYINTCLNVANYKVFLRWYLVPACLASIVLGASYVCFCG